MITFRNKGLLPIEAIKTMGVSAKVGESPIGFFGTGLKYAIAVLLRDHQSITIHIDKIAYEFGTRDVTIRDKSFTVVTMNDQDLGFTTDLGRNWDTWMAYRELYSNCMDEGGSVSDSLDREPAEGETVICVDGIAFDAIHADHYEYFLDESISPDIYSKGIAVYFRPGNFIFYKGIRSLELVRESLFVYNMTQHEELTEDRNLKFQYTIFWKIVNMIVTSDNVEFIKAVLLAGEFSFESTLNFGENSTEPSITFLKVAKECLNSPKVNHTLLTYYKKWSYRSQMGDCTFVKREVDIVQIAREKLDRIGYELEDYVIKYFDSPDDRLSVGCDGVIYLDKSVIENRDVEDDDDVLHVCRYLLHAYFQEIGEQERGNFEWFLIDEILGKTNAKN